MSTLAKRQSLWFVIFTFILIALTWVPLIFLNLSAKTNAITFALYMLGGFSPTIVALLLPLFGQKSERKEAYKRYFRFKISWKWYLIPLIAVALMGLLSYVLLFIFHKSALQHAILQPWYMIFPLFINMIVGGGLEELGWRGVLVHNLREKNPTFVALIVGVIWSAWHIPLFYLQGVSQFGWNLFPFFVLVIGLSFATTALYLRTKSVIPCVILHAGVNAYMGLGFVYGSDTIAAIIDGVSKLIVGVALFALLMARKGKSTQ